jgi:acetyl esterase/lipase
MSPAMATEPNSPNARPSGVIRTDFPGGGLQSRTICWAFSVTVKPMIWLWSHTLDLPWPYRAVDYIGRLLRAPKGLTRIRVPLPHRHAQLTIPPSARADRFVVYLHGGAFRIGHRHLHRQMIGKLAILLGAPMLAVDYRMLPKHRIADAINDAVHGYEHALKQGVAAEKTILMGDSAGGYLVLMAAIEARNRGLPCPGAVVAISPLTTWETTEKWTAASATPDPLLPRAVLRVIARTANDNGSPPPSPVDCDLYGLPPTLIQVSDSEMLYPDAVLMASRLAEHGVSCELQVWPDQLHVFQACAGILPEGAAAMNEIADFVDRTLAGCQHPSA